jgi:transcriptional regulator with XRE-family HTH domain/translation initiation factor IF-1
MTVALAAPEGRSKSVSIRRARTSIGKRSLQIHALHELGERMRTMRTQRGYSMSETARLLDVAKQTISNWELAIAPPKLENLVKFCALVGVEMGALFDKLSPDLVPIENMVHRLALASRLVPLMQGISTAGERLMLGVKTAPQDYVAPLHTHPNESVAFKVTGAAMEPRFCEGDVVIVTPVTMAERGTIVLAYTDGGYVFRKFLPKVEGRIEGAILRALNDSFLDIEMTKGDALIARLVEHISNRQG